MQFLRRIIRWISIGYVSLTLPLAILWFIFGLKLAFNVSQSLPYKLYLIQDDKFDEFTYGDFIAFKPTASFYRDRLLIKIVMGLEGDKIELRANQQLYVHDKKIGTVWSHNRYGQPLTPLKLSKVPKDFIFASTPHPRSFDSRYQELGLVPKAWVVGKAIPIF